MTSTEDLLSAIDAIIYGDLFHCAVTFDEIWQFSRIRISEDDLRTVLESPTLEGLIAERGGLYCLAGREDLFARRVVSRERAEKLRRRAIRVARVLRHAPFVRGLILTGSVAAADAHPNADVDFLVVVEPHRLSTVFLLFGSLSRLITRSLFCPNYYIAKNHLTLGRQDYYVAREVIQASLLTPMESDLRSCNPWALDLLPNSAPQAAPAALSPCRQGFQRLLEFLLSGRLGDALERWARGLAHQRLQAHYGLYSKEVPKSVREGLDSGRELRFHGNPYNQSIHERYLALRDKVAESVHQRVENIASSE